MQRRWWLIKKGLTISLTMGDFEKEAQWLLKEKYAGVKTHGYEADLTLLHEGTPLAYLIGHVQFLDTTIYLHSRPLIPRVETEYWVETCMKKLKSEHGIRILDLCAGSGCIGIALLKALPDVRVDFAEIEIAHHVTIEKNIRENGIKEDRAHIYGGDLFEHATGLYHYIFSNPPYIDPLLSHRMQPSVTAYEPERALLGGVEGIELITRILEESPDHLHRGGVLYLEHEPEQSELIRHIGQERGFKDIETHKDQYGMLRMTEFHTA
jgi:release factor glutamine methyltransferase